MSLLAPASCDQPVGYYCGVGCMCVCVCEGVWGGGFWAGNRRGGVGDEGGPHENQRNSLATGDRINTKWGAPIHAAPSRDTEPKRQRLRETGEREGGREGRERERREKGGWCEYLNERNPPPPFKLASADINTVLQVSLNVSQH